MDGPELLTDRDEQNAVLCQASAVLYVCGELLSWSGSRAKEIAQIWKALIEESFDSVDAFVPSRDIDPGERGLSAIKEQLDGTSVGIPIITRDNVNPPWINFESGALSKQVPNAPVMVMPCLVDYKDPSELIGPLLQFQSKLLDKDGVAAILETIAKANSIDWQRKKPAFEARWGEFEAQFDMLRDESPVGDSETRRSEPDMLAEIVNNTREIRKMFVVNPIPTQVGDTWAIRLHDQGKLEQQRRHLQVGLFAGH